MLAFLQKQTKSKGLCTINFSEAGVALSYATSPSLGSVKLNHYEYLPCDDPRECTALLAKFVNRHQLQGTVCDVILSPEDYHLLLIDKPPVEENEIKKAAYYLTKDLLNFPIEEAAIDIFEIPVDKGKKPKIYVVISQLALLRTIAQQIKKVHLKLRYIQIAELALLNFFTVPEFSNDETIALLFSDHQNLHLLIVQNQAIRFTRLVGKAKMCKTIGSESSENSEEKTADATDQLVDEIRKSFNYYQTDIANQPPARLLLPMADFSENYQEELQLKVGIKTEPFDLNAALAISPPLSLEEQRYLLFSLGESLNMKSVLESVEDDV
jgi:MSHA biogenesis protein MshI